MSPCLRVAMMACCSGVVFPWSVTGDVARGSGELFCSMVLGLAEPCWFGSGVFISLMAFDNLQCNGMIPG